MPLTELAQQLQERGVSASDKVVKRLLSELGFGRRKMARLRSKKGGNRRQRDQQFGILHDYRCLFVHRNWPIFSIDSKKTEYLGNLFREGAVWSEEPLEVLDHDFPSYSHGHFIPHGIYDLHHQHGHLNFCQSSDTGDFAVDSLAYYWQHYGRDNWPDAEEMLLLCDCGGSNKFDSWVFKQHLQQFAQDSGLVVRVAHYPVYCSKYNPIERRLFSQVHPRWQGMQFDTVEDAAQQAREVTTTTGLHVTAEVWHKHYQPHKTMPEAQRRKIRFQRDDNLPMYNYVFNPKTGQ